MKNKSKSEFKLSSPICHQSIPFFSSCKISPGLARFCLKCNALLPVTIVGGLMFLALTISLGMFGVSSGFGSPLSILSITILCGGATLMMLWYSVYWMFTKEYVEIFDSGGFRAYREWAFFKKTIVHRKWEGELFEVRMQPASLYLTKNGVSKWNGWVVSLQSGGGVFPLCVVKELDEAEEYLEGIHSIVQSCVVRKNDILMTGQAYR